MAAPRISSGIDPKANHARRTCRGPRRLWSACFSILARRSRCRSVPPWLAGQIRA